MVVKNMLSVFIGNNALSAFAVCAPVTAANPLVMLTFRRDFESFYCLQL